MLRNFRRGLIGQGRRRRGSDRRRRCHVRPPCPALLRRLFELAHLVLIARPGITMPDPLPAEAPVARVTLSRAAILSARALLLAFSGTEKRAVVERAIKDGPLSSTPIGRVLAEAEGRVNIHWAAA